MKKDSKLSNVGRREALPTRKEPYWEIIVPNLFLGFRPSAKAGKAGAWTARLYDPATRKQTPEPLGHFADLKPGEMFAAAHAAAMAWAATASGGRPRVKLATVADACRAYAAGDPAEGIEPKPAAAAFFENHVYPAPLAAMPLGKMQPAHFVEWRKGFAATPSRGGVRAVTGINRDIGNLRAAMNAAKKAGAIGSDNAWREPLWKAPTAGLKVSRDLYLEKAERRQLLDAVRDNGDDEAADFYEALCLLPFRPGAMAGLTVGDLNKRTGALVVRVDKTEAARGRTVWLDDYGVAFMARFCRDKLPGAPIFMQPDGSAWDASAWKKPINRVRGQNGIPAELCAYTLRHSGITDLVATGLPSLDVAKMAGTSVDQIEEHYYKNRPGAARAALATLRV